MNTKKRKEIPAKSIRDDPQSQRLMDRLQQKFKSERTLEEVKTTMLKLRHEWGKPYEYLNVFID